MENSTSVELVEQKIIIEKEGKTNHVEALCAQFFFIEKPISQKVFGDAEYFSSIHPHGYSMRKYFLYIKAHREYGMH